MQAIHDVIGIGFGPGNLALAIALRELHPSLSAHFVEARASVGWQEGMMIGRANIQHHPSIDLVTPRNPRSKYTFINYLFENDLLFRHFNLGLEYPLRQEYAHYIDWAAKDFAPQVSYRERATNVSIETSPAGEPVYAVETAAGRKLHGRILVLGPGRTPYIPEPFDEADTARVIHLNHYLPAMERLAAAGARRVAVVGASQSAVEILLDIARRFPGIEAVSYIRHFGFRLKDISPFMEESVFPQHVRAFYDASRADKESINTDLRYLNYSAADADVIKDLYLTLYEQRASGRETIRLMNNSLITAAERRGEGLVITSRHRYTGAVSAEAVDAAVLATGFRDLGPGPHQERFPPLIKHLGDLLRTDDRGVLHVNFDYSVEPAGPGQTLPPLFLNGLCEASHGVSDAGSFSLLSLRSRTLVNAIADRLAAGAPVSLRKAG